jgi:hypothetical protein
MGGEVSLHTQYPPNLHRPDSRDYLFSEEERNILYDSQRIN